MQALPADFLQTMEDFVKEMPKTLEARDARRPIATQLVVNSEPTTSAAFAGELSYIV